MMVTGLVVLTWQSVFIMMIGIKAFGQQCSCYYFHSDSWSRYTALYRCKKDQNGVFVSMETIEEWEFIKMQIKNRTTDADGGNQWYIGLEKINGEWKWSTGHILTYNKWGPGMPLDGWQNRYAVMTSGTGLFRTTGDINPKGKICEKKVNSSEECSVRWCLPGLSPTTPMTYTHSASTSTSDHDQGITTNTTIAVMSTQSIGTSIVRPTQVTTDHRSSFTEAPSHTKASQNHRSSFTEVPSHAKASQSRDPTIRILIVIIVVLVLVLVCTILAVIFCKHRKKNSKRKRRQRIQNNESMELEPREHLGGNSIVRQPSPATTAECTDNCDINQSKSRRNTWKSIPMATDDGYASVDDTLNNDEKNIDVVEAEYATVQDALINVKRNDICIETNVSYAFANIKGVPDNFRNIGVSFERESEYATTDKENSSNGNDASRDNDRIRSQSCSPNPTVLYAVVDKSKKRKRSETVAQCCRSEQNTESIGYATDMSTTSPSSTAQYAVVDKSKKNKYIKTKEPTQGDQGVSASENSSPMNESVQNNKIHSVNSEHYPNVEYAVIDKSRKNKVSKSLNQKERDAEHHFLEDENVPHASETATENRMMPRYSPDLNIQCAEEDIIEN